MNRACTLDVGKLMLKYGGGHRSVGACQFTDAAMEEQLAALLADIQELNG